MPTMATEQQLVHVTLTGGRAGRFVIEEERADGRLVLAPDTSAAAIRERGGSKRLTPQQWENFLTEHGPHMLPPDGEGIQNADERRISASSVARVRSTPRSLRP